MATHHLESVLQRPDPPAPAAPLGRPPLFLLQSPDSMTLQAWEKKYLLVLLGATGLAVYAGWSVFWFLTDDAYISFRYVSNSLLGYGYVWNPPPFRPIEGYTNFLWVVLLDAVWRTTGIAPPQSANVLALGLSFASLLVLTVLALKLPWRTELTRYRLVFLSLVLCGVVGNRTFLAWTSSGLETALFNLLLLCWVASCLVLRPLTWRWVVCLSASAAGLALTRPDGLLFVTMSLGLYVWLGWWHVRRISVWHLVGWLPLLSVVVHLAWRRHTYGAWLPNTYYAKYSGPWLESGLRYAGSFVLEYALWLWLLVGLGVGLAQLRALRKAWPRKSSVAAQTWQILTSAEWPPRLVCVATLVLHAAYYTFVVGGDHFEYRVYSHLIGLIFVSFVWLLNVSQCSAKQAVFLLSVFVLCSYPVPWSHWALSQSRTTRAETFHMQIPLSAHWPPGTQWYARTFDRWQCWLIERFVSMRHQEHKVFHQHMLDLYPPRSVGQGLPSAQYPILATHSTGVPGWVLPRINIVDQLGLNDYVIARQSFPRGQHRRMAHDRYPPDGYVDCLSPNVFLGGRRLRIVPRTRPLTGQDIIACEQNWAKRLTRADLAHTRQAWLTKAFLGLDTFDRDHLQQTQRRLNTYLGLLPDDVYVILRRGAVRGLQGDTRGALSDYQTAARLEPRSVEAQLGLGKWQAEHGNVSASLDHYARAIDSDPTNALAYYLRGQARQQSGDLLGAIADYDRALHLYPTFVAAYNNRGVIHKTQGNLAGAVEDYQAALRSDPTNAAVYCNLATAYAEHGALQAAVNHYTRGLAVAAPDWPGRGQAELLLRQVQARLREASQESPPGWD